MSNLSIPRLIEEISLLTNRLTDQTTNCLESGGNDQIEPCIQELLEKVSPYRWNKQLCPPLGKLREACKRSGLEKFNLKIQSFVIPILQLPIEMLTTITGFLTPKELTVLRLTSNPGRYSLAKASDKEILIRIEANASMKNLELTETLLLSLLQREKETKIKTLNLDGIPITDIVTLLNLCSEVDSLSAVFCNFTSVEAKQIASYPNIHKLNLKSNSIGNEGAKAISTMSNLTSLNLTSNHIGVVGIKAISLMGQMITLTLTWNAIGNEGAKVISTMSNLTSLNLTSNQIGVIGIKAISKMHKLKTLILGQNKIGTAGIKIISKMSNLTSLNLESNKIGPRGAKIISKMPNLTSLNLEINPIQNKGAIAISKISKLTTLYLANNYITFEGIVAISRTPTLRTLSIISNQLGDEEAIFISRIPNLKSLCLKWNQIGAETKKQLAQDLTAKGVVFDF